MVVCVLIAFLVGTMVNKRALREQSDAETRLLLDTHARAMRDFFHEKAAMLQLLAQSHVFHEGDISRIVDRMQRWKAHFPNVEDLFYNEVNGTVHGTDGSSFSVADRDYFDAVEHGEVIMGKALTSRASGRRVVLFLTPILTPEGQRTGALGATVELEHLIRLLGSIRLGDMGYAVLGDRNGNIVTGPDTVAPPGIGAILFSDGNSESQDNEAPRRMEIAGEPWLAFRVPIPSTEWSLVMLQNEGEALAPVRHWNHTAGLLLAMITGFALIASLALRRLTLNPISHLMDVQRRIAEGDALARANWPSRDEFGQLARSFNSMADAVAAAHLQLSESEALFRAQFELGQVGMAITSAEKRWIRVNQRLCDMLACTEAEFRHRTWAEMTHPEDMEEDTAQFARLLSGEIDVYEMDKRFLRKDGTAFFAHLAVSCMRNTDGSVRFVIAAIQDITMDLQLGEDRKRLIEIIERSTDLVSTATLAGNITYLNPAGRRMASWGLDEDISPRRISDIHPEWALEIVESRGIPTACEKGVWQGETALKSRYGREIPVSQQILAHRSPSGKLLYLSTVMRDITERKNTEEGLRANERRLRTIIENSSESIVMVNEGGDVIEWNPAAERITGIPRDEAIGARLWDVMYRCMLPARKVPERIARIRKSIEGALNGQPTNVVFPAPGDDIPVRGGDGGIRYIHQTVSTIRTERGVMLVLTASDVTERREGEEAIRRRGDELATLNHIARAVTEQRSLKQACAAAVREVLSAVNADVAMLFVREKETLALKACTPETVSKSFESLPGHQVGECLCGIAAQTGTPAYSLDIRMDARCMWPECKESGFRSFAAVPLHTGEGVVGVLGVGSKVERDFRTVSPFLETAADHLAVAVRNVLLYEESQAYAARLQQAIAERETAQQALLSREREAREASLMLRNVLDTIPVRVFWKDRNLRYIGCNVLFALDAGLQRPFEVVGKDDYAMAWHDHAEKYRADDRAVMKSGRAHIAYEEPQTTPDGRQRVLRTSKTPLRDESGAVIGLLGTYEDITEQKHAQEALEESRRQLQDIAANIPFVIYQFYARRSGERGLYFLSERSEAILGLANTPDTFLERITQRITEKDRSRFLDTIESAIIHRIPWHFEGELVKPSGQIMWLRGLSSAPQQLGEDLIFNGVLMDITEERSEEIRAATALDRVERQKNIIARVALFPSMVEDAVEALLRELTEATAAAFGIERVGVWLLNESRDQLACADLYELSRKQHTIETIPAHREFIAEFNVLRESRYIDASEPLTDPRTAAYADSYIIPLGITSMLDATIQAGGRTLGALCLEHVGKAHRWEPDEVAFVCQLADQVALAILNRDRRNAEAALRESEQKFRTIFESSPYSAAITDANGRFVEVNTALCNEHGLSPDDVVGRRPNEVPGMFWVRNDEQAHSIGERLLRDGLVQNVELDLLRPSDGATRTIILSASIVTIAGQHCVLSMLVDVTDRKRLEEQLRQSQKMEAIGQLAGGVAHDFNNLLQAILGYTEIALDTLRPSAPLYDTLMEVAKAGERAVALTRQLLAFSRRQVLHLARVDLNAAIEDLMKMVRRLIGENIELVIMPGHDLAAVQADRGQFEQVLINLCVNARDAMPDGGRLTIQTRNFFMDEPYCTLQEGARPGPHVLVSIADTGCGMDAETQRQIFEPFFTTKAAGKGTGLGLATVYGIVRQHGGIIQVYSEIGKGTCFNIYLPAVDRGGEEDLQEGEEPVQGGSETILLAEDVEQVRLLGQRILEKAGYRVIPAADGEEALALYRQHSADVGLLLLDVIMPKMGGRSVLERVKEMTPEVKCLFVSGYSEEAIQSNFLAETGLKLLPKPYSSHELLRTIRAILDG